MTGIKAFFIIAIVAVVVLLITRIRIGAIVEYSEQGLLARARVGPVKITLYPPKPKKDKPSKAERKPPKKKKAKQEAGEEPAPRRGGSLAIVKKFLPLVTESAGKVKHKIRLDKIYLDITMAAADPAAAALAFGGTNAAVGMIWPMIEQNFNVKDRRIRTAVDFQAKSPTIYLFAAITLTIGQAMSVSIPLLCKFLKRFLEYRAERKPGSVQEQKQKEAV